ncbi:MAG: hypothetical protein WA628_21760, partial [Terriglobales bacterium]
AQGLLLRERAEQPQVERPKQGKLERVRVRAQGPLQRTARQPVQLATQVKQLPNPFADVPWIKIHPQPHGALGDTLPGNAFLEGTSPASGPMRSAGQNALPVPP